jgi:hypothetical protein
MSLFDNTLPLDDPEGSARWIAEQDDATLWAELDSAILFIAQASLSVGSLAISKGNAGAIEDRDHGIRLARQIMTELQARLQKKGS